MTYNKQKQEFLIDSLRGGLQFLWEFLKNPVLTMKNVPSIPIGELIFVGGTFLAIIGLCYGLISGSIFSVFWGVLFFPFIGLLSVAFASLYLFYITNYLTRGSLAYPKIFTTVFLAAIPSFLFLILSPLLKSVAFLGFVISAFLLRMGFTYSLKVEKKLAGKIILSLFAVILLGYLMEWLRELQLEQKLFS